MQNINRRLKVMETRLHAILSEMQELKNEARELDEENARLRKELAASIQVNPPTGEGSECAALPGPGFINLLSLYDQSFHICNLYFGHRRTRECLFCMAFLRKELEPR